MLYLKALGRYFWWSARRGVACIGRSHAGVAISSATPTRAGSAGGGHAKALRKD